MNTRRLFAQLVALPALIVAVAALWLYCTGFLAVDLQRFGVPVPLASPVSVVASLLLLLIAPALPLASLFRRRAALAAAGVGWPPVLLAILLHIEGSSIERSAIAVALGTAAWASVVLGAWLASRRWPTSQLSAENPFKTKNAP